MRRHKILIICNNISSPAVRRTGISAIYNLLCSLAENNNLEIYVLSSAHSGGSPVKADDGLKFHYVKGDNLYLLRAKVFFRAVQLNNKYDFDLIHDYSSLPVLIGLTGLLGLICRCKTVHTLCTANTTWLGSSRLVWGAQWLDKIICVDKLMQTDLGTRGISCSYIPLGVKADQFLPLEPGSKEEEETVLFLGPLERRKGAFVLANAVEQVLDKNTRISFIFSSYGKEGRDPNFKMHLKQLTKRLSRFGDSVKFIKGEQDVPRLMSNVSIFCLPTTSRHGTLGQPLTLLEAMAAAKPCIVSDIYKGAGLVKDGENCLLFNNRDYRDLADRICQLIKDEELACSLSTNARKTIEENFKVEQSAEKVYELYKMLLQ